MRFLANVRRYTGRTKHYLGSLEDGEPVKEEALPRATTLEIVERDGVYFLTRLSKDGKFAGETAHETLEEAKRQAKYEFEVDNEDWCPTDSRDSTSGNS
jgi:hypothetical protein